ncbi:MAG: Nudix family hydrolase [Pseudomonadota bacterium]|nr:Nudix family hydrolase [Pseudomonadota bacterium]
MALGDIHVAVGVIQDREGRVLLAQRPTGKHLAGYWEFPGGKLEPEESVSTALTRELLEELGIVVDVARPLIRLPHAYPEKRVLLDVWTVIRYHGQPRGREGQRLAWVAPADLKRWQLPSANEPIVRALDLPDHYLVTPDMACDIGGLERGLIQALDRGTRLIQLRLPSATEQSLKTFAARCLPICHAAGARVLLNGDSVQAEALGFDGVHLNAARLRAYRPESRPAGREFLVAASCHDHEQLALAQEMRLDFVVLGSVCNTRSHPEGPTLGWDQFRILTDRTTIPVYAIGGMKHEDLDTARGAGAQGIAAIRGLWRGEH